MTVTTTEPVHWRVEEDVLVTYLDDGKVNAVRPATLELLGAALDQALARGNAVCLLGRAGVFCAGYDREAIRSPTAAELAKQGQTLLERINHFPRPVVAGISGAALGFGAALLLACDQRVAGSGSYQIGLPETRLGLRVSPVTLELAVSRLSRTTLNRSVLGGERYTPIAARDAGFIDEVVDITEVGGRALELAAEWHSFPPKTFRATKKALRAQIKHSAGWSSAGLPGNHPDM